MQLLLAHFQATCWVLQWLNYDPLVERNPMKRIGTAEDVGGLAIFLSSRAGNFTLVRPLFAMEV